MRYLIDFSYDGSLFNGYQKQPNKRTVQGELERVLSSINNSQVKLVSSGRTDSKVNALHQVAHFDFSKELSCFKLKGALNSYLPPDIHINDVKIVDDSFHARYMVKEKWYQYKINMGNYNPLLRNQIYQFCKEIDVKKLIKASKYLIGTFDFTSFASAEDKRDDKIRTIYDIKVSVIDDILIIDFIGTGFLKYQIRNMVGFLLKCATSGYDISLIPDVIKGKDRRLIGITAPACGLTLMEVRY